jgi:hypothetical protein
MLDSMIWLHPLAQVIITGNPAANRFVDLSKMKVSSAGTGKRNGVRVSDFGPTSLARCRGPGIPFSTTCGQAQIDLVILRPHDKLPAPLESACRWLSFFPLIKSSLK